jgi:hypothetical protein
MTMAKKKVRKSRAKRLTVEDLIDPSLAAPTNENIERATKAINDLRNFLKGPRFPQITQNKKRAALWALAQTGGMVLPASRMVRFDRGTHTNWLDSDSHYKAAFEAILEDMLDVAEGKLMERVRGVKVFTIKGENVFDVPPDTTAIMYLLNNRGGKRGYGNRVEVKHTGGKVLDPELPEETPDGH